MCKGEGRGQKLGRQGPGFLLGLWKVLQVTWLGERLLGTLRVLLPGSARMETLPFPLKYEPFRPASGILRSVRAQPYTIPYPQAQGKIALGQSRYSEAPEKSLWACGPVGSTQYLSAAGVIQRWGLAKLLSDSNWERGPSSSLCGRRLSICPLHPHLFFSSDESCWLCLQSLLRILRLKSLMALILMKGWAQLCHVALYSWGIFVERLGLEKGGAQPLL